MLLLQPIIQNDTFSQSVKPVKSVYTASAENAREKQKNRKEKIPKY
jgi:hypothetical protein